jgi:hypothetical protein
MIENSLSIAVTVNLQQFQVNQLGGNPQPQKQFMFEISIKAMCEQERSIAVMIENSLSIVVTVNLQQFQVNQLGGNPQPQKLSIFERFFWQGSIKAKREQERSVAVMIENWLSIFALIPRRVMFSIPSANCRINTLTNHWMVIQK